VGMTFVKVFFFFIGTLSSGNPYFHANLYLQPKGHRGFVISAQSQSGDPGSSWLSEENSGLQKLQQKQQKLFDSDQNNFMEEMGRVLGFSDGLQNLIKIQHFGQQPYYKQQPYNILQQQPIETRKTYIPKQPFAPLPYKPQPQQPYKPQPQQPYKPQPQQPYHPQPQQPYFPHKPFTQQPNYPRPQQPQPRQNGELFPDSNDPPRRLETPAFIPTTAKTTSSSTTAVETTTTTATSTKQRQYCHSSLSGFTFLYLIRLI